jgi:outer membrane protein
MKKSIQTLSVLAAFGFTALLAQAQPTIKLLVVDMAKLYDTHYETEATNAKLRADEQSAQEEVEKMNKEGNALVADYTSMTEQLNNPLLTAEAKAKYQNDAQKKLEDIQRKKSDIATFAQNTQRSLQQRLQNFRTVMLEKLSKSASEIAKRKGATLLVDKSGPSLIGVPNIIYSDAAYDITDEVTKEVNKDRPAVSPAAAPAAAMPAPAAAAPAESAPSVITVPGVTSPKK